MQRPTKTEALGTRRRNSTNAKIIAENNYDERMRFTTLANQSQERKRGVHRDDTGLSSGVTRTTIRCRHLPTLCTPFVKHYKKLPRKIFLRCFLQRATRCPANADNAQGNALHTTRIMLSAAMLQVLLPAMIRFFSGIMSCRSKQRSY
jgi:hypothetical protein